MNSEDELLCSCCCDNTEEKDYEKEEKTQGMGITFVCVICFEKFTSDSFPGLCLLIS